jgi:hypothetical protein
MTGTLERRLGEGALAEAMNFRGPALVNVVINQPRPQQFRWHS